MKNPFRAVKLFTRANRLYDVLADGAKQPALYRERAYWTRVLNATAALVDVAPIPLPWRRAMNGLIRMLLGTSPLVTLIGVGGGLLVGIQDAMMNGMSLKSATMFVVLAAFGRAAKGDGK